MIANSRTFLSRVSVVCHHLIHRSMERLAKSNKMNIHRFPSHDHPSNAGQRYQEDNDHNTDLLFTRRGSTEASLFSRDDDSLAAVDIGITGLSRAGDAT